MMNTPNKATMDSAIKECFNGNHTRMQGEKWPLEKSTIQEQRSILGCRYDKNPEAELQEEFLENIPSRIDPCKVGKNWSLLCLFVTAFSRILGYNNFGFRAKDRSFWDRLHYIMKVTIFLKDQNCFWAKTRFSPEFPNGNKLLDWINLSHWRVL